VSLQPSAGSHGELAGVLLTRAYHEDHGQHRTKVLTPDTAHGTNPATVTMAGYETVKIGTDADGNVDIEDLRAKATAEVALPDADQPLDARAVRAPDRRDRRDRARGRRDPLLRRGQPQRDHGDLPARGHGLRHSCTFNLHKSFTQPHGGGGPGAGPIAVADRIEPFLPRPQVVKRDDGTYDLDYERPKSIGRLRGFQGNYGVFVRSYAYIRSLGHSGLREVSEVAVLNANYLLARLREEGVSSIFPPPTSASACTSSFSQAHR